MHHCPACLDNPGIHEATFKNAKRATLFINYNWEKMCGRLCVCVCDNKPALSE